MQIVSTLGSNLDSGQSSVAGDPKDLCTSASCVVRRASGVIGSIFSALVSWPLQRAQNGALNPRGTLLDH